MNYCRTQVHTMTKLYPIHRPDQPYGQSGMLMDWLCTAITLAGASHTTHLQKWIDTKYISLSVAGANYIETTYNVFGSPGNELSYCALFHRHHRYRLVGRQPERFIVPAGVVADVVEVTEKERHGTEFLNTRSSKT